MKRNIGSINGVNIDLDTGEEIDGAIVYHRNRMKPYEEWIMNNQEAFLELAHNRDLTGQSLRVFFILLATVDYENKIPVTQKWVSDELSMSKSQVSRSFKQLIENQLLFRETSSGGIKFYRLSYDFCWKGKVRNLREHQKKSA